MKNITIVGAGHVGLITGVTLAEIGHQIVCYDVDKELYCTNENRNISIL